MPFEKGKSASPETEFKPGQSGNPNGRPKGYIPLSIWIQKLMNDEDFELTVLGGKDRGKTISYNGAPVKAIVGVAIHKAIKGDVKWAEWLGKHGYGNKIVVGAEDPVEAALRKLGLYGDEDAGEDSGTTGETS